MNEELKEKCPGLKEYMMYVERIRELAKELPINEAVEQAVEDKIKTVFLLCKEFGSTKEQTIKQVIEKCGLKRQTAEEKAELYWQ